MEPEKEGTDDSERCLKRVRLDRDERLLRSALFNSALGAHILCSDHDSVTWLAGVVPPGFDFDEQKAFEDITGDTYALAETAITRKKEHTYRWLLWKGARANRKHFKMLSTPGLRNAFAERVLAHVIAHGLAAAFFSSDNTFADFLTKGVCEVRLLIQIAGFVSDQK